MKRVGLICGWGNLPRIWAGEARKKGYEVIAFPVKEEETPKLKDIVTEIYPVKLGSLNGLINLFKKNKIEKAVMLGKVRKSYLFTNPELDCRFKEVLSNLKNLNDNNILLAIVKELNKEGIEVLKQSTFLEDLMVKFGNLTRKKPSPEVLADMQYGFNIAHKIAEMDIGQTVIVKDKTVLAVEAIEGTDETIKRGGFLAGSGVTMAKGSSSEHDFRFDIPTIGLQTLDYLENIKARGLVIEAGRTFLLYKSKFINKAEETNIAVVAMEFERG